MEHTANTAWPPTYTIKRHRRARGVKLRASQERGLEITTPFRFNLREIPQILEQHKSWIIKQLLRLEPRRNAALPDNIAFPANQEIWRVDYVACQSKLEMIERPLREIVLAGKMDDKIRCKALLIAWVKQKAKIYLSAQLTILSEYTQLHFNKVSIRDQKTMWGSCTAGKAISLNYKLLFLPPELVSYVIIHELCHIRFLNHSQKFWALVQTFDPDWQTHRRQLRKAESFIPVWI